MRAKSSESRTNEQRLECSPGTVLEPSPPEGKWLDSMSWADLGLTVPEEISQWIRFLQPLQSYNVGASPVLRREREGE